MTVYYSPGKTNCLTYTPKNINLTLSNGTLTLKKGSKVYVPNGFDAVRYYKYTYADWTQPVLTADGVLGGDSFAVYADPTNTDHPAYYAFDSSTSTYAVTHGADYIIYNKNPINITKIDMTVRGSSYNYRGGTLYGSNDNSSWKEIIALSALTNGSWDISSNTGYYKYYKFSGSAGDWQPKTLTLTATQQTGSVESTADDYDYTVGSGQMKFDEVVIESDISTRYTYAPSTNSPCVLFVNKSGKAFTSFRLLTACVSGTTRPSGNYINWYDTNNNIIESINADNITYETGLSLPFAIITQGSDGNTISIDQIFDWCGYIGSTAFVLPNVKGLIPNGFNADRTYKSTEFETDRVLIDTVTSGEFNRPVKYFLFNSGLNSWGSSNNNVVYLDTRPSVAPTTYCTAYIKDENRWIRCTSTTTWTEELNYFEVAESVTSSSGTITSLTPYSVKTTNDAVKIKDLGDHGVYVGSTPIESIYNGSQLVYEWSPYNPNTVLYNNGNIGAVTWTQQCPKGIYQLSLAGGGGGASSGYYYWPAGNRGAVLVCEFKLEQSSLISVSIGAGTSGLGGVGGNTVFSINGVAAVTCPGNGGTITIDNSVINILSTITSNTGGGGGGSGSNPTPLSPWGDGGHTNSAAGRGGGMRLEWLRLK